jgi:hypothetical protein
MGVLLRFVAEIVTPMETAASQMRQLCQVHGDADGFLRAQSQGLIPTFEGDGAGTFFIKAKSHSQLIKDIMDALGGTALVFEQAALVINEASQIAEWVLVGPALELGEQVLEKLSLALIIQEGGTAVSTIVNGMREHFYDLQGQCNLLIQQTHGHSSEAHPPAGDPFEDLAQIALKLLFLEEVEVVLSAWAEGVKEGTHELTELFQTILAEVESSAINFWKTQGDHEVTPPLTPSQPISPPKQSSTQQTGGGAPSLLVGITGGNALIPPKETGIKQNNGEPPAKGIISQPGEKPAQGKTHQPGGEPITGIIYQPGGELGTGTVEKGSHQPVHERFDEQVAREAQQIAYQQVVRKVEQQNEQQAQGTVQRLAGQEALGIANQQVAEQVEGEEEYKKKKQVKRERTKQVSQESKQVGYGSTDLSQEVIKYRRANNLKKAHNVAVFEYKKDGVVHTHTKAGGPGVGHTERIIAKELTKQGVHSSQVTRVYSELKPGVTPGGYGKKFLNQTFPQAQVTYSFDYGTTHESRQSALQLLIEFIEEIFKKI